MTETIAARFGFGWGWDVGESGWKAGVDQNFRMSDTFIGLTVIDDSLTAPPGSPGNSDTYLVATGGTGSWSGHDGKIAAYQAGTWYFYNVAKGLRGLFLNHSAFYYYDGSAWGAEPSGSGLSAVADGQVISNIAGSSAVPTGNALSALLDHIISVNQGAIVTRTASGWAALAPSATAGQAIISNGTSADIGYATIVGAVASVVGATGTVTLANLVTGGVLPAASPIITGTATAGGTLTVINLTAAVSVSVPAPSSGAHATTKTYVDTALSAIDAAAITTGVLAVARGGTGLGAVGNSGGVLAYVGTGTLASSGPLAANRIVIGGGPGVTPSVVSTLGVTGQALLSNGVGSAPNFGAIGLAGGTSVVSGRLPFANVASLAAATLWGNSDTIGATGSAIAIGAGITLSLGTLSVSGSGIPLTLSDGVTSVINTGSILVSGGSVTGTGGNATLTISGASGVTNVVAQGGPFLANVTISATGTISNSTASLTPHGILFGEGTGAVVASAAMTNGQILIGATGADPAPQTMSGDATINAGGTLNLGSIIAGGTVGSASLIPVITYDTKGRITGVTTAAPIVNGVVTLTGTAGGTLTLTGTAGFQDMDFILNMPTAGGTVTLHAAPAATPPRQRYTIDINQGATVTTIVPDTTFAFNTLITGYVADTASTTTRMGGISPNGTKIAVWALAQGFTI